MNSSSVWAALSLLPSHDPGEVTSKTFHTILFNYIFFVQAPKFRDSGLPQTFPLGLSPYSHGHHVIDFPVHRQPAPRAVSDMSPGRGTRKLALLHSKGMKRQEAETDCSPTQGRPWAQGPLRNSSLASRRASHVTNIPHSFQEFGYL